MLIGLNELIFLIFFFFVCFTAFCFNRAKGLTIDWNLFNMKTDKSLFAHGVFYIVEGRADEMRSDGKGEVVEEG